ncbi:LOW QUALITY PROTEIN: torsin-4A [Phyllopteryx taeniolatus]|uniref:LOW QUALITY PROTEIN: torsin-4A n=1 Tax=Phyllopteryx taeniolatus TaxID=161469 RepID=UPI002AD4141E|nr:LOW QUALITY PROTEIN: torsin-4A [Phyllopteryx taeniolatus]
MKEVEPPAGLTHTKVGWRTQWSLVVQSCERNKHIRAGSGRSRQGQEAKSLTGRQKVKSPTDQSEMTDRDSSSTASHTEDEMDDEEPGETEDEPGAAASFADVSSTLRAVIRIKQKYRALKKRRQEMALVMEGVPGAPARGSPKIFTFDPAAASASSSPQRKKRKRKRRVLYPNRRRRKAPGQEHSPAEFCLYLLSAILFVQVYNAIENLDDHVIRYDLEGLEKTLRREVFGQQGAVEALLWHLKEFLTTYVHNRPLVVSLHGPSGVGKSHLGRLLAGHFRSVVGEPQVLQYFVLHHCPPEADAPRCAERLVSLVSEAVELGEREEKIPLFVLDEAEHMHAELLDALLGLVGSPTANQFLNAIYVVLSDLGHELITKHLLHNVSTATNHAHLARDVTPVLRRHLEGRHPLWAQVNLVPLGLLEKSHVTECFLDEMSREGFYPDRAHMEQLAAEIRYYPAVGGREYSVMGCKQVVAKVNLL